MFDDLDAALNRLATRPTHPGLVTMEDQVLARVHASGQGGSASGLAVGGIAAIGAVLLGVAGAGVSTPLPATSLAPLGSGLPLAPSTLLASDR